MVVRFGQVIIPGGGKKDGMAEMAQVMMFMR